MDNFQSTDNLLKRNWFLDDSQIVDVLNQLDVNTREKIYKARESYPGNVQFVIAPMDFTCQPKRKMKCGNLSDQTLKDMEYKQKLEEEKKFEELWKREKKSVDERPHDDIDDKLDDLWDSMQEAINSLKKYSTKKGSYIPPSIRGKEDPKLTELQKNVQELENEFKNTQKLVDLADNDWLEIKKNEYRRKTLFKL